MNLLTDFEGGISADLGISRNTGEVCRECMAYCVILLISVT